MALKTGAVFNPPIALPSRAANDRGLWRDTGRQDRPRARYTPSATMHTAWLAGPANEFVDRGSKGKCSCSRAQGDRLRFVWRTAFPVCQRRVTIKGRRWSKLPTPVKGVLSASGARWPDRTPDQPPQTAHLWRRVRLAGPCWAPGPARTRPHAPLAASCRTTGRRSGPGTPSPGRRRCRSGSTGNPSTCA